ncbi:hypothetical protein NL676_022707 [Syzygium grande]|nr:hypothetical protein NL676_022707 [Syzygium grande]
MNADHKYDGEVEGRTPYSGRLKHSTGNSAGDDNRGGSNRLKLDGGGGSNRLGLNGGGGSAGSNSNDGNLDGGGKPEFEVGSSKLLITIHLEILAPRDFRRSDRPLYMPCKVRFSDSGLREIRPPLALQRPSSCNPSRSSNTGDPQVASIARSLYIASMASMQKEAESLISAGLAEEGARSSYLGL